MFKFLDYSNELNNGESKENQSNNAIDTVTIFGKLENCEKAKIVLIENTNEQIDVN